MIEKEILKKRIQIVYSALQKQERWYTGISLKRYLKSEIFALDPDFSNSAIEAGRWSAYCHYNQIMAFENLLDKHQIDQTSRVLVHPLLPSLLVERIVKRQCEILTLDISKSTLGWDFQDCSGYIRQQRQTKPIDLIVQYGFNGIYEPIIEIAQFAQTLAIPTLVVIDNKDINLTTLDLFSKINLGSVLWYFGDSFWDDQLDVVMDTSLPTQNWFLSWFIETRMRSTLEYHLRSSHQELSPILEAYFYLLLEEQKKDNLFAKTLPALANRFLLQTKFSSAQSARDTIRANYESMMQSALPDIVFDLQMETPVYPRNWGNLRDMIHRAGDLQIQAKFLYDYFIKQLPTRPAGSLEIPDFYLDKSYLKYFVFTTELNYWYQTLHERGYAVQGLDTLHPLFAEKQNLPIARFVSSYLLSVDVNQMGMV